MFLRKQLKPSALARLGIGKIMKHFCIAILSWCILLSCEENPPEIISNPNAMATFEECIPLSFVQSNSIEVDSSTVSSIQNALRLARTVDIELQDIEPYNFECAPYNRLEIHFPREIDSTLLVDSCKIGIPSIDSILTLYSFDTCVDPVPNEIDYQVYSYTFETDRHLNIRVLGELLSRAGRIHYAGYESIDCEEIWCDGVSLSIISDVFTFKFHSWCKTSSFIEWVVVVTNEEATLISKTS